LATTVRCAAHGVPMLRGDGSEYVVEVEITVE
jgi:hypothetical protein